MELLDRLKALSPEQLSRHAPADATALRRLEAAFGRELPEDFRALMEWSNGLGLAHLKGSHINVEPAEQLPATNQEDHFREHLPGMFIIGTDGGGAVYYFDPKGLLGHGANALYLVDMGTLGFDYSILAGRTFTEAMNAMLEGEELHDRPWLKKLPGYVRPGGG